MTDGESFGPQVVARSVIAAAVCIGTDSSGRQYAYRRLPGGRTRRIHVCLAKQLLARGALRILARRRR